MSENIKPINNKLSLFEKINQVRADLLQVQIKKSGKNNHTKYSYLKSEDILPIVNQLCVKYGIYTKVNFIYEEGQIEGNANESWIRQDNLTAQLHIYDLTSDSEEIYQHPFGHNKVSQNSESQNIGAGITYHTRYLFMQAFQICEHDVLETLHGTSDNPSPSQKLTQNDVTKFATLIERSETDLKKFLKFAQVDRIEDISYETKERLEKLLLAKVDKTMREANDKYADKKENYEPDPRS